MTRQQVIFILLLCVTAFTLGWMLNDATPRCTTKPNNYTLYCMVTDPEGNITLEPQD